MLLSGLFLCCPVSLFLVLQIPSSPEVTDSRVDAIPKTEDGSIDWSQVGQIHVQSIQLHCSQLFCIGLRT